jgi:formate hydrogenlyase transcriptional activator
MSLVAAPIEKEDLQSTLESLRQSEELKARLLETSRDCVKILDLDARLLYMNEGGMSVLEICDLGPVIGSSWIEFWNGDDKIAAAAAVDQARHGEIGRFVGYFPTTQTQQPMWWDVVVTAIKDADGLPSRLLAVSHDITALKRGQQELEQISLEQAVLLDINRAINRHLNRDELFRALAHALKQIVPSERFGIELPIEGGAKLQGHSLSAIVQGLAPAPPVVLPASGSAGAWVMQTQQRYIAASSADCRERFPVTFQVMSGAAQESLLALPLVSGGQSVAALYFMASDPAAHESLRFDFLDQLAGAVAVALDNCMAHERLRDEGLAALAASEAHNRYLQEEIRVSHNFEELIGSSAPLKKVLSNVERVAPTESTVLISGETGTGKELIARAIHNLSPRKARALVKVNCAAIPAGLVESELFGHEKGAFTGALARRTGRFELADKGTLFLDEIGELPLDVQSKLLRVLQEGEFERVGSAQTLKVNVRVIAATNRDLAQLSKTGQYRADLYYRLNVFPIHLPPLREREGDLRQLAHYFVQKIAAAQGKKIERVPERLWTALQQYRWPGNIRELQHVIERAVVLSEGPELAMVDWLDTPSQLPGGAPLPTLEELERNHIVRALEHANWKVSGVKGAAAMLGLKSTTLDARIKKLGIRRNATA